MKNLFLQPRNRVPHETGAILDIGIPLAGFLEIVVIMPALEKQFQVVIAQKVSQAAIKVMFVAQIPVKCVEMFERFVHTCIGFSQVSPIALSGPIIAPALSPCRADLLLPGGVAGQFHWTHIDPADSQQGRWNAGKQFQAAPRQQSVKYAQKHQACQYLYGSGEFGTDAGRRGSHDLGDPCGAFLGGHGGAGDCDLRGAAAFDAAVRRQGGIGVHGADSTTEAPECTEILNPPPGIHELDCLDDDE